MNSIVLENWRDKQYVRFNIFVMTFGAYVYCHKILSRARVRAYFY